MKTEKPFEANKFILSFSSSKMYYKHIPKKQYRVKIAFRFYFSFKQASSI